MSRKATAQVDGFTVKGSRFINIMLAAKDLDRGGGILEGENIFCADLCYAKRQFCTGGG
jgi:hypothetical protein